MGEPLLSLRNVRVQYGRFLAVDDLSLDVCAGELLGLVGPNGAGKTTTLRAASGLLPIATGSVRVLDFDVFEQPTAVGRHLGLTPDNPAVYDALTVEQYLEFIARCYDLPADVFHERVDHWLEQLWLVEKRQARVSSLSRGMKQRLAVARTLLPDPHVVLLDEPAAGLDPAGRVQLRRLLAALRDQGKAVVVSSHILSDLEEVSTHIAIMERGKLRSFGTVAQLAGGADHARCRYRVVLTRTLADASKRLQTIEGAMDVQIQGDVLTLEYDQDREAAARLLGQLLAAGLPIAEFRSEAPDLEQAYLRSGIGQVD